MTLHDVAHVCGLLALWLFVAAIVALALGRLIRPDPRDDAEEPR